MSQMSFHDWRFSIDYEGIAWAIFDREGTSANTLGRRPLEELERIVSAVEAAAAARECQGLVFLSGKEKSFILGADVAEFETFTKSEDVEAALKIVLDLLNRIEALSVPVAVGIHGLCLGGGLELALACHWRVATRDEGTRVAFPEVKLGIFPGWHGTVRSIRQAGAMSAMQMMLTGSMISASRARAMGLIDELVASPGALRWACRKAVLKKKRAVPKGGLASFMTLAPVRGLLANKMRAATAKKVRADHYPAPFRLIDLFEAHAHEPDAMKRAETRFFAPLLVSETSRNLRRVFRLSELLKAEAPKAGSKPLRVHVIGAGTMGADIAGWCVAQGMEVTLQDLSKDQIETGIKAQAKVLSRKLKTKIAKARGKARLIADPEGAGVSRADVIIEAIVEKLEVKQALFRDLETKIKPTAVLATNTSSLKIEDIAAPLKDPGRLVGIHFFNPVAQMPLVEVIHGEATRGSEVRKAAAFVTAIGKFPLVVKSVPGFLVNRVLAPYMMAAMARLEAGEDRDKIDEAARVFGMPMGPIELADTVGLDVCRHVGRILGLSAEGSRLDALVTAGKLGKKSGEGFYVWEKGKPQRQTRSFAVSDLEALGLALVEPLIAEAQRAADDGIVASKDHVDAGVIFGTGFAPFRGGPLHYKAANAASKEGVTS